MRAVELPPPPSGYFFLDYQITIDGRLVVLFSTADLRALGRFKPVPRDVRSIIAVAETDHWRIVAKFQCESLYYAFDLTVDDCCVVADPRCAVGAQNARMIRGDTVVASFCLGDGIEHLQCDGQGDIWVGYFDEGIFGSSGWGTPNGPAPIGAAGIVRFSPFGNVLASSADPNLADCYALNADRDFTWTCYYPEFSVVRLAPDFSMTHWKNVAAFGAKGLAVRFPDILFIGDYDVANRLTLARFETNTVEHSVTFDLDTAFCNSNVKSSRYLARADAVHMVDGINWKILTVGEIASDPESFRPTHIKNATESDDVYTIFRQAEE